MWTLIVTTTSAAELSALLIGAMPLPHSKYCLAAVEVEEDFSAMLKAYSKGCDRLGHCTTISLCTWERSIPSSTPCRSLASRYVLALTVLGTDR